MASNSSTIADGSGEYSDWIEIYNPGPNSVDLGGYYVSDQLDDVTKYQIPSGNGATVIPANDFLLLWASDDPTKGVLHLPFKLSASGEAFVLAAPDGTTIIDSLSFGGQQTDVSYGRQPDGSGSLFFFSPATPRSSNNASTAYGSLLAPPEFSVGAGFYPSNVQLSLLTDDPEATIYYTLDGSEPSPDHVGGTTYRYKNRYEENPGDPSGDFLTNAVESYVYATPLTLTDRASAPNSLSVVSSTYDAVPAYFPVAVVNKANVVRAVVAKPGALSSEIVTNTYFVNPQGRARYTLPVVSVAVPENKLFDYDEGIYVAGVDFDNWRAANPSQPPLGFIGANYLRRGDETEAQGNFEYYDSGSEPVLNQGMGIRIHGGASRAYPRKSLRLYARSEYGESEFDYPFFPEKPRDFYKRLLLRNSGSDWYFSLFRDAVAQRAVSHLRFDTQASQPCVVFLDGEYWGVHNLRERLDKYYLASTYGVNPDSVDILENRQEVQEGSNAGYLAMLDFLNANSLTDSANYAYIKTLIDIDNFTDYQIAEIHSANDDWVNNNVQYWRKQTAQYEPDAPYGQDGRWRWLMYDLDEGYRMYRNQVSTNTLDRATTTENNFGRLTLPLRRLLENTTYRNNFISRFADLLNTTFKPARLEQLIDAYAAEIDPEIDEHIQRWRFPATRAVWESNVDETVTFAQQRPGYVREHIRGKFGLPAQHNLTLGVSDTLGGFVRVNTIDIEAATPGVGQAPYPWTGIYFQDVPVTLTARPKPDHAFLHWQEGGAVLATDSVLVLSNLTADRTITAVFEAGCQEECRSLSSGDWFEAGRWSCGHVPLACEAVVISQGQTVSLPAGGAVAKSLHIENGALLDLGTNASLQLSN